MALTEFLRANQDWVAPIIEWGGLLLLLFITFSPFLIIRHRMFKPTRWRHIVGAYASSFLIFVAIYQFYNVSGEIFESFLSIGDLYYSYDMAFIRNIFLPMFIYPLLVFYSAKLLHETLSKKVLLASMIFSIILFTILFAIAIYFVAYGLGQASYNF